MEDDGAERRMLPVEAGLLERLAWFIRLRWMAGLGVLAGAWGIVEGFNVPVPARPLYEVGAGVLAYNAVFCAFSHRWAKRSPPLQVWRTFAHAQIGVDWMALSLLVLRSGGVRSPVVFAFIFHIIIAADLLPRRACYAHTGVGAALVGGMAALECAGVWSPGLAIRQPAGGLQVVAHTLFLIGTFGAAAFLGTSITNEVRRRERELADSEQTLARAYDQLEKLDRDKSRFALTVTHELRAPLATATSLLETLSEGYAGPLTERQADLVRRTKGRMEGLRALINDLLDLAAGRTEMTRRRAVPVDVREAVQAAVEGLRGRAESRRVDLAANLTGDPLAVSIDPADLRLALDNLLDNAIKYTPPGGTVRVTVREKERMGEWAEVAVADTGMGIPAEELSRIFDDFYRAANAKAAHADGTGLGLAIVKGIVERYGGHILVESEVGRGSRFEISWPAGQ